MTDSHPYPSLYNWGFYATKEILPQLKKLAEPENWPTRPTKEGGVADGLSTYLDHTFRRGSEQKKVVETKDHALWNTGLVTPLQEEIFAFANPNNLREKAGAPPTPWCIVNFYKSSDYHLNEFASLPDAPTYLDEASPIALDGKLDIRIHLEHILEENLDRFPLEFAKKTEFERLALFRGAFDLATKRLQRNHRMAVPHYYRRKGGEGKVQWLMPLGLTDPLQPDVALSIDRRDDVYKVVTVLTLPMAYSNARLIARPESNWLSPVPPDDE